MNQAVQSLSTEYADYSDDLTRTMNALDFNGYYYG